MDWMDLIDWMDPEEADGSLDWMASMAQIGWMSWMDNDDLSFPSEC